MRDIHLASPDPSGRGTADVESLTSYVRRLARVHRVSVSRFLTTVVFEPTRRQRGQTELALQPTRATESINGSGAVTRLLVAELSALTRRDELMELTFLGRDGAICMREAFRVHRAWCTECFVVDDRSSYDRLIWTLREYRVCLRHGRPLSETCADCGQPQRPMAEWAHPLRCHTCGGSLRFAPQGLAGTDALQRSQAAGVVFERAVSGHLQSDVVRADIVSRVSSAGSFRRLSKASGVSVGELSALCAGRVRPHFSAYVSVITGTALERSPRARRPSAFRIRARLERAIHRPPVPSLRTLAREMGTTPTTLRGQWPSLAGAVVAAFAQQRAREAATRRSIGAQEIQAAVAAAAGARQRGRRHIERRLKAPGLLRAPWARQALRRARREAAYIGHIK